MLEIPYMLITPLFALVLIVLIRLPILNLRHITNLFRPQARVSQSIGTRVTRIMDLITTDQATQDLKIIEFERDNYREQTQSPLFQIPGEIRDRIYSYVLAEFEDTSTIFDNDSCYRRPEYAAPRRSDTALLRTCQRVYQEAFFYPFALAEQILWLAWDSRRPPTVTTVERLQPSLALIQKLHGETELNSIRLFAQLCKLESGHELSSILDMPHFFPRSMTITIRHTDIWSWESDSPIHIGGHWTEICRFPSSLRCLNVQVESLERKKDQIDYVVSQMIEKWRFTRRDQTILQAAPNSATISRWSGSSTWEGQRWIRDEIRPETLDYYIATVPFHVVTSSSDIRPFQATEGDLWLGPMPNATILHHPSPSIPVSRLTQARVPSGLSADEVLAHLDEHRRRQQDARNAALARNAETSRQRRQLQQAKRSTRSARAAAEVATAYPHHQAGGAGGPARITADMLRAARAARRLRRGVDDNGDVGSSETMDGVGNLFSGGSRDDDGDRAQREGQRASEGSGSGSGSGQDADTFTYDFDYRTMTIDDAGEGSSARHQQS